MKRIIIIAGVVGSLVGYSFMTSDRLFEISKNIEIFVNVFKELNTHYVDEIDPGKLMYTGIEAMVSSLDPYTNYISESKVESYRINQDAKYKGIGADVDIVDDKLTIIEPYQGSSLVEQGLRSGDVITKINGIATAGKPIEEIRQVLRGVEGTSVQLGIKTLNGQSKDVTVERTNSSRKNVPYSGFVSDGIGYITLTTFTADAGKNVGKALKDLKRENPSIKGVILDLRNNGGGLLREAINITNIFLPKDELVVSTRSKLPENDKSYRTTGNPIDLDIPVAVLINKRSASASEIVSGVLQDFDRGVIVGQRSYGKGLVQNTQEVGYNSRVKLTISKYYIPSGRCIQSVAYEDGKPKDIPDSERSAFKTKAGRTVLDGGGITPDVKLNAPIEADVVKKLKDDFVIFKFVNEYLAGIKDTIPLDAIKYNDFAAFKQFAGKQNFKYISSTREILDQYEEEMEEDLMYADLNNEIVSLRNAIKSKEDAALDKYRDQILVEINKEIAARYYYQKGRVYSTLDQDAEVKKCIDILSDDNQYKSILR